MPGYTILYHITTWHREGGSHYTQSSDMGFHFKENIWDAIENDLDEIPDIDYIAITKHTFFDSLSETKAEEIEK